MATETPARIAKAASYKRIATEEAWLMQDIFDRYLKLVETRALNDPAFESLWGYYGKNPSERSVTTLKRILDLGAGRLADMDASGIDVQLLLHTAPGVQVFDAPTANGLAAASNDMAADAVRKHPDRFAGLALVAPQDPPAAGKELERAVKKLGLKGAVINSHIRGEFLNDQKFWGVFEAAEALDVPIYIHPSGPPPEMAKPFIERGLDGAIYGFAVECGLHLLTIITSGAFDRFPKLQIVVGHLGEGLPFWIPRLDYMHAAQVRSKRYEALKPLKRTVSEYLRENVYITTSGMNWEPAVMYCRSVLGNDRVLYAMDYPYQFEPSEVVAMDALPVSDAEKKAFYQTNAEKVFKL
ncbi:MAG: amidohydrolase [Bradyrhizobiaceae bacterium]|nr:amidohydrolase [Bradyrhizobiaceae bacterium]